MPQALPQAECSLCREEFKGQDHLLCTEPFLLSWPSLPNWQLLATLGWTRAPVYPTWETNAEAQTSAAFLLLRSPSSRTIWMASGNPRLAPRLWYLPPFQLPRPDLTQAAPLPLPETWRKKGGLEKAPSATSLPVVGRKARGDREHLPWLRE